MNREKQLRFDQRYLEMARIWAKNSYCQRRQVGALVVKQTILPSGYVHSDTLVCKLVDESGKFRGQGVSYYQQTFHLNTIRLHEGDSLHINIKHNMKREVMLGVSDIGFRIDEE